MPSRQLNDFPNTAALAFIPQDLKEQAEFAWEKLQNCLSTDQNNQLNNYLQNDENLSAQTIKSLTCSDYLLETCCRYSELFLTALKAQEFSSILSETFVKNTIFDAVDNSKSSPQKMEDNLRRCRRYLMLIIYWRHINGLADFKETSSAMTSMAEAFTQGVIDEHYQQLVKKFGLPIGKRSGEPQPFLVIGMGKLGGKELNVSSDIDLLFAYPDTGITQHDNNSIDNQSFFEKLGRALIKTLDTVTQEGFVFRVDMRLRPFGTSGPLVSSFASLQKYYREQGREWERFAALKARVVAEVDVGSHQRVKSNQKPNYREQCHSIFQSFVYRHYLDYSALESLRNLKKMIQHEVRKKKLSNNIKLGEGGIREIEFIVQCFQLIRGGYEIQLQERNLLAALKLLSDNSILDVSDQNQLAQAYVFLRQAEHAIQAHQDQQTQQLPDNDRDALRLAWILRFKSANEFTDQLRQYRHCVSRYFQEVIEEPQIKTSENNATIQRWQQQFSKELPFNPETLKSLHLSEPDDVVAAYLEFWNSRNKCSLSKTALQQLNAFLPLLFVELESFSSSQQEPLDTTCQRIFDWLESIITRSSYLTLLLENPKVIANLIDLFSKSKWIAQTLTFMPALLDDLIQFDQLLTLPDRSRVRDELRQRMLRVPEGDLESYLEVLHEFRLGYSLQVAACELNGALPLMKASDYLTFTAEAILEEVMQYAVRELVNRHGLPQGVDSNQAKFLMVGYGKLGGIEMSYGSDLDLVFIYDTDPQTMTTGTRSIDSQTFYTRLGQKIIHVLTVQTLSGSLYDVDMRLRPSGNSGMLVTSMKAFDRYQSKDAWVWEHQALVRARPITGDPELATSFREARQRILQIKRPLDALRQEIIAMREKMRAHLGLEAKPTATDAEFHLKQDAGGIVDIEFMVQYLVLARSCDLPDLAQWTDNIRILESIQEACLLSTQECEQLVVIYQTYRQNQHRAMLEKKQKDVLGANQFQAQRRFIVDLWNRYINY